MKISSINNTLPIKQQVKYKSGTVQRTVNNACVLPSFGNKTGFFGIFHKKSKEQDKPLPDNYKERLKEIEKYDIASDYAESIAKLAEAQYHRAINLMNNGISEDYIEKIATLDEKKYNQAISSIDLGISSGDLNYMANLKPKDFSYAEYLREQGLNPDYIKIFTRLNTRKRQNAISITNSGYPANIAAYLSQLNKEKRNIMLALISDGTLVELAFEIANLSKAKRQKCLTLIKNGISAEEAVRIAQLTGKASKQAEDLMRDEKEEEVIADLAQFKGKFYQKALELYNSGVHPEYIADIIFTEQHIFSDKEYKEYLDKGYAPASAISLALLIPDEMEKLNKLIEKHPEITELFKQGYIVDVVSDQLTDEPEGIFSKIIRTPEGTQIKLVQTYSTADIKTKSRTERYKDNTTSSIMEKGNRVFRVKYDRNNQIKECLHIMSDDNTGGVTGVIYSKASDILSGVFDSTEYTIDEIRQDSSSAEQAMEFDINKMAAGEGTVLSKAVRNPDGSISFFENFDTNGFKISRKYEEKKEPSGTIAFSRYSFKINNPEGESILDTERTMKKNPDGSRTNTINGIEYHISYNDKDKTITISDGTKTKVLYFKDKLPQISQKEVWQALKEQPADTLLTIDKNIKELTFCEERDSQVDLKHYILSSGQNLSVISHETGHIKDNEVSYISDNDELIETYDEEMLAFVTNFAYSEQDYIRYFSQRAELTNSVGIDEFIAETNLLLNTYGTNVKTLTTRAQFLARYFPRTIALTANLLGKNSKESLLS